MKAAVKACCCLIVVASALFASAASACDQNFSAFRSQCVQSYVAPLAVTDGCHVQAFAAPVYSQAFVQPFVVQRFRAHHNQAFRAQRFRRQRFSQQVVVPQNGTVIQRGLFNFAR